MATPLKKQIKNRQLDLKYRPWHWDDLVGHKQAVSELQRVVKNSADTLPAAIGLFGESGRGKTTLARMLATYLNCETGKACGTCKSCELMLNNAHPDYKEVDCTEVGVDEVGGIITKAQFKPQFKTRVILLDEIHKLKSANAANNLLKPLEEPPLDTIWIIATNLPEKIPNSKAILGRCMSFYLKAPAPEEISARLLAIAKQEKVKWVTRDMTDNLAHNCNAQVRNSVKMLERLINSGNAVLETDPKSKRLGKISAKLLPGLLSEITSSGMGEDAEVDAQAEAVLMGLYASDPGPVISNIMASSDHVKLVNKMLYLNQYVMADQYTRGCKGIWHTDQNRRFAAAVKKMAKGNIPAQELGVLHKSIVEMRIAVVSGGVDASQHLLAHCMSLMLAPE